jgi:hypothetical protein
MTRITIMKTALGWEAMVFEGDRPRGEALPLPYAPTVPTRQVAIELLRRFPGCEVHCSAGGVTYRSPKAAARTTLLLQPPRETS